MNRLSGRLLRTFALSLMAEALLLAAAQAQEPKAQPIQLPEWQVAAGGKMEFDVASVKQNKSGLPPTGDNPIANFPLEFGDGYTDHKGFLSVTNFPLITYIAFAYKLLPYGRNSLRDQLPKWATSERFDIEARGDSNATKDQMRLMMQSLLADRFKFSVHFETKPLPAFVLVLAKPGKTGPQLRPHSEDPPCSAFPDPGTGPPPKPPPGSAKPLGPGPCGRFGGQMAPGQPSDVGARNITMEQLAGYLVAAGNLDHPVVDQTGLPGRFDLSMQYTMEPAGPQANALSANSQADQAASVEQTGTTFLQALQEQLGLKLEPRTAPVEMLIIDHIEEPSEN